MVVCLKCPYPYSAAFFSYDVISVASCLLGTEGVSSVCYY